MTKDELKQLSDTTFPDNNSGQITPAGHRNFNNTLIDSVQLDDEPPVAVFDLAVTTEQLTGDTYNGKPVYSQMKVYTNEAGNNSFDISNVLGVAVDAGWIDKKNSRIAAYGTGDTWGFPASMSYTANLDELGVSLNGSALVTVDLYIRINYTKAN
jgi:hypothetical protein